MSDKSAFEPVPQASTGAADRVDTDSGSRSG